MTPPRISGTEQSPKTHSLFLHCAHSGSPSPTATAVSLTSTITKPRTALLPAPGLSRHHRPSHVERRGLARHDFTPIVVADRPSPPARTYSSQPPPPPPPPPPGTGLRVRGPGHVAQAHCRRRPGPPARCCYLCAAARTPASAAASDAAERWEASRFDRNCDSVLELGFVTVPIGDPAVPARTG